MVTLVQEVVTLTSEVHIEVFMTSTAHNKVLIDTVPNMVSMTYPAVGYITQVFTQVSTTNLQERALWL